MIGAAQVMVLLTATIWYAIERLGKAITAAVESAWRQG